MVGFLRNPNRKTITTMIFMPVVLSVFCMDLVLHVPQCPRKPWDQEPRERVLSPNFLPRIILNITQIVAKCIHNNFQETHLSLWAITMVVLISARKGMNGEVRHILSFWKSGLAGHYLHICIRLLLPLNIASITAISHYYICKYLYIALYTSIYGSMSNFLHGNSVCMCVTIVYIEKQMQIGISVTELNFKKLIITVTGTACLLVQNTHFFMHKAGSALINP